MVAERDREMARLNKDHIVPQEIERQRISLAATAISLFCGLLAGYALSRLKFPFAGLIGTGIFITYLVPQTLLISGLMNSNMKRKCPITG